MKTTLAFPHGYQRVINDRLRVVLLICSLLLSHWVAVAADDDKPYVIPDLQGWSKVEKGMTVEEVEKLIGKPIKPHGPDGEFKPRHTYVWTYGYVVKESPMFPEDLSFYLNIELGKVVSKHAPFGEVPISEDGKPTVPKLMTPYDKVVFEHFPRLMDFRWYPSSGDYPMKYEIEIGVLFQSGKWKEDPTTAELTIPYFSYIHSGVNAGRWRVRATNAKGKSDWSEYFLFVFTR